MDLGSLQAQALSFIQDNPIALLVGGLAIVGVLMAAMIMTQSDGGARKKASNRVIKQLEKDRADRKRQ